MVWPATSTAEATAKAALKKLSAGATMTWSSNLGALSAISNLNLAMPGCVAGKDFHAELFALLAANPDLFQIDVSEWQMPLPFDCGAITTADETLTMRRKIIAGHPATASRGEKVIGFDVSLDVQTGAVENVAAGIGCDVC